jgi:hypothetical protein
MGSKSMSTDDGIFAMDSSDGAGTSDQDSAKGDSAKLEDTKSEKGKGQQAWQDVPSLEQSGHQACRTERRLW